MNTTYFLVFGLVLSFVLYSPVVVAEDSIQDLQQEIEQDSEKAAQDRKRAYEDAYDALDKISEGLSSREKQHLFLMQMNQNLVGKVKSVRASVSNAVKECGKNNPEMKSDMNARYKNWNGAVSPLIDEANGNINNMMIAQGYAKTGEIKGIFKLLDEARDEASNKIEKVPVTTPEACQFLLSKMDETQDKMVEILSSTLVSFPQLFQEELVQEIEASQATEEQSE